MENKAIYVPSLEASYIWEMNNRCEMFQDKNFKINYIGMIPYSLESIYLQKNGLKFMESKSGKKTSTDIINVKFNRVVRSGDEIIKSIKTKREKEKLDLTERDVDILDILENHKNNKNYQYINIEKLRNIMYTDGFFINNDKYVVYKRSSSKSRTGEVLFIKEKLYREMKIWSRMNIQFEDKKVDYTSLLAYESLVSSTIQDVIEINVDNILLISDVVSQFVEYSNIIEIPLGNLKNTKGNFTIENDLFDGQSLLDKRYFPNGKSMKLLRNHMFKSCAFSTDLQRFFRDNDISEVRDMFGNLMKVEDIHMITTPNSLKALKFRKFVGGEDDMYKHWQNIVKQDGCIFGVCKEESPSQKGYDCFGNILNQTSYQMINSLNLSEQELKSLVEYEINYTLKLKNDDNYYIQYLEKNSNLTNSNQMLVDLYKQNNKIVNVDFFKTKRAKDINKYVNRLKSGKIRVNGDYATIIGNGLEMLYHSIGKLPVSHDGYLEYDKWKENMALKKNECVTTLHKFDREYIAFRNPHTSPSNILKLKNVFQKKILKYFQINNNIIYVNAINYPIQNILSGMDYDSDTLLLVDNPVIFKNANRNYRGCKNKYLVCVNNIEKSQKQYIANVENMAKIDNSLAKSQTYIGKVVNLGQRYLSQYFDALNHGQENEELLEKVNICTVLSEVAIDMAKKEFAIDVNTSISSLEKSDLLDKKPYFLEFINKDKVNRKIIKEYQCSMDKLQNIIIIPKAISKKDIKFTNLLLDFDHRKAKSRQVNNIITIIDQMIRDTNQIWTIDKINDEMYLKIEDLERVCQEKIKRYNITQETIYKSIIYIFKERKNDVKSKHKLGILNTLYSFNPELFLSIFKIYN